MSYLEHLPRLERRLFLKALGLGIAAPLSLRLARLAHAEEPARRPVRLLMIFMPHGFPVEHFDPIGPSGQLDFQASGLGCFRAFAPHARSVTYLRGAGMGHGATNHMAIRAALTGAPEGETPDSVDALIARELGVTPHVLGAQPYRGVEGFGLNSYLARHGGAWIRATESPLEAAEALFENVSAQGSADERSFEAETLALSARQVQRLYDEVRGLTVERSKLAIHLESLQTLREGGGAEQSVCGERPALAGLAELKGLDPLDEALFGKVLDAQLENAAEAMVCGTGRVITLQVLWVTSNTRFDFPGGPDVPMEHHATLSHLAMPRDAYARVQQWICDRIGEKLLKRLNRPDPADLAHSVLDNSIVYLTTEVSDGSGHVSNAGDIYISGQKLATYLPQLVIGGGGGYFKPGGRIVQLAQNRPHTDVLGTLAAAMGVQLPAVGGRPFELIREVRA